MTEVEALVCASTDDGRPLTGSHASVGLTQARPNNAPILLMSCTNLKPLYVDYILSGCILEYSHGFK